MTDVMYQAVIVSDFVAAAELWLILEKAMAHADAKKIDPSVLVNARRNSQIWCMADLNQAAIC